MRNSRQDRGFQPSLAFIRPQDHVTHYSVPLKTVALAFVEHLLNVVCCSYHFLCAVSLNPNNNPIQIHHLHVFPDEKTGSQTLSYQSEVMDLGLESMSVDSQAPAPTHSVSLCCLSFSRT